MEDKGKVKNLGASMSREEIERILEEAERPVPNEERRVEDIRGIENDRVNFSCANDIRVNVVRDGSETLIDEECCTMLSIILKNNGELATSFLGAHNRDIIKALEKTLKIYMKSLKKALKHAEDQDPNPVQVSREDIPEDKKMPVSNESEPKTTVSRPKPAPKKSTTKTTTAKETHTKPSSKK